ncbi:hypothetical protein ES319_D11G389200v1, partial [Gossypium barbadense]
IALSHSVLLSSRYAYTLNSLLFSKRNCFRISLSYSRFTSKKHRSFAVSMAISDNGIFISPELAKSFDFTSDERIYNWWLSQGYFRPKFDWESDPFVIS